MLNPLKDNVTKYISIFVYKLLLSYGPIYIYIYMYTIEVYLDH